MGAGSGSVSQAACLGTVSIFSRAALHCSHQPSPPRAARQASDQFPSAPFGRLCSGPSSFRQVQFFRYVHASTVQLLSSKVSCRCFSFPHIRPSRSRAYRVYQCVSRSQYRLSPRQSMAEPPFPNQESTATSSYRCPPTSARSQLPGLLHPRLPRDFGRDN